MVRDLNRGRQSITVDTLLWMVSLGEVMETTAKAVAVTVTTQLVRKPLFLVVMALVF
ncbi:hypothetical protein PC116_g13630 [Phytophthora cactorum]|uniref:Uncharacterized protein n=1 Tax=Phytophthora cactorum TaxID=29920 RepID=A0A329SFC6_9STRA|nr:hypothetical protein Pcac1_g866 [Phytophthora cactorum]KAG2803799.1 hypothetical protein PC111_g18534 [Phytophthora cactorum]KAG2826431.1 hypothetical protein PC112_g9294 [Phytophthora cactorum]KAG2857475.1 hypothetical protein PC113_g10656 [Phytophthora cactorum]KAG2906698.1 hypothetical protein PC114_g11055 [Phytophthora cactorum]